MRIKYIILAVICAAIGIALVGKHTLTGILLFLFAAGLTAAFFAAGRMERGTEEEAEQDSEDDEKEQ